MRWKELALGAQPGDRAASRPTRPPAPPFRAPREFPSRWARVSAARDTDVKRESGSPGCRGATARAGDGVDRVGRPGNTTSSRGKGGYGWAVRRGRPQGQVAENLFDRLKPFNERDDSQCSGASWTHERIDFVDLLDAASTSSAERRQPVARGEDLAGSSKFTGSAKRGLGAIGAQATTAGQCVGNPIPYSHHAVRNEVKERPAGLPRLRHGHTQHGVPQCSTRNVNGGRPRRPRRRPCG